MHFIKQTANFDLGDTPIENIFINDFMPMANGTYVKVYLLGYKYANDKDSSLSITQQTISKHLNIPLSDVLDAWDFWEQKGIIKKHLTSEDNPFEYSVEFLNLKQLYIDNHFKSVNTAKEEETSSSTYICSPEDLVEANKVPEIKDMFYTINQLVRRSLVPKEMMTILDWIYNYNMDPDVIIHAFMYCVEQKNIKNIKYVGSVIRNWYDRGVISIEKLNAHLDQSDKRYATYREIFKVLGFGSRLPSKAEKETMNIWIDEWKFDMDIILKACENTRKTSNPNINYINSILKAWKNDHVQSIEDIKEKEKIQKTQKKSPGVQAKKNTNKFHNFKQRTSNYTKDELERILKNKQR